MPSFGLSGHRHTHINTHLITHINISKENGWKEHIPCPYPQAEHSLWLSVPATQFSRNGRTCCVRREWWGSVMWHMIVKGSSHSLPWKEVSSSDKTEKWACRLVLWPGSLRNTSKPTSQQLLSTQKTGNDSWSKLQVLCVPLCLLHSENVLFHGE